MAGAAMVAQGFIDGGFAATMFRQTVGSRVAISSGRPDRSGVYGYVESENEDFARRLFEEHYGVHEWRLVDRTG